MTTPETATNTEITIRRMDLYRRRPVPRSHKLAALDSHAPLDGPVLGAEVEGELRAAISVDGGELVADPFARTSELRALLRAARRPAARRAAPVRRRRRPRRERPAPGGRAPALGGSPAEARSSASQRAR